jgi:hypothetical protein
MADEESLLVKKSERSPESRWLPRFAALVGLTALLFQTTILYPWHRELSLEFSKLSLEVLNKTIT